MLHLILPRLQQRLLMQLLCPRLPHQQRQLHSCACIVTCIGPWAASKRLSLCAKGFCTGRFGCARWNPTLPRVRPLLPQCTVDNCESYQPGDACTCSACSAGYRLNGAACEQVNGSAAAMLGTQQLGTRTEHPHQHAQLCKSTRGSTDGLPSEAHPFCPPLLLQAQCSVPNCQAYSAGSGCSCTACIPGYRLASGSCQPVRAAQLA